MLKFEDYNDAVYAHTDYVKYLRSEMGAVTARAWLKDRDDRYGQQAMVPSAWAFHHAVPDAINADVCWLTTEMMDLVQVAMADFDYTEPISMEDVFIPNGFMVLPHAFLGKDIHGKTIGWRMIGWHALEHLVTNVYEDGKKVGYTYDLGHEGESEGGVRFMQVSWVWDDDDYNDENPEMVAALRADGEQWGIAHATAIPFGYMNDQHEIAGEGDRTADWLLFWRVAQRLMSQRIVTKDYRQPSRAARREAQRYGFPPPILRVIELRRPRSEHSSENGRGRTYTHRWIVRGHWRNQPYGPGRTLRRQQYIGSYVAGPDDLELIVKQRVWNWDR